MTIYRTEVISKQLTTVVPSAASSTFDFTELPIGAYEIGIAINSNVTGASTTIEVFPFVDQAQTAIGPSFAVIEPDDTSPQALVTLGAGAEGRTAQIVLGLGIGLSGRPQVLPYGFRVTLTKGGAATGELLELTVTAVRTV